MRTFSRKEAAHLLGISVRTLGRWLTAGKITAEKIGEGQFAELRISLDELERVGLYIAPEPEPCAGNLPANQPGPCAAECAAQPEPIPEPLSPADERRLADQEFARKFLAGEIPDSMGNFVDGHNPKFESGPCSLLGPLEPRKLEKLDTCSHMDPALVGRTDVPSADSPEHPLNRDFKGIETKSKPMHPNAPRQLGLHVTVESWLAGLRNGYSR